MNLLMKGAALAPPFSCTTKYSSDVYSPRPPDIRVRLLPTKPPVHFTTEQPGRDSSMPVSSESSRNLLDFLNDLEEKVMWQRNNGQAREELQIKFTGYLIQAVRRTQRDYLKALYAYSNQETLTDTIFVVSQTLEQEVMERLPLWENIESGALLYALKQLDERERYVFLARVLDKRPFDVIGVQLGLSYKGAAAVYYRAIRKLKKSIEGVNGYDI